MARKPAKSDPVQLPPPDQREAKRFTLLLRVGQLRTVAGEFLCVLRDVSERGLKIRLFHQIPQDENCELELSGGESFRVARIWQKSDHAGLRFYRWPDRS